MPDDALTEFSLNHIESAAPAQLGLWHPEGLSSAELGYRGGVTARFGRQCL